jgi:hypothetical protein
VTGNLWGDQDDPSYETVANRRRFNFACCILVSVFVIGTGYYLISHRPAPAPWPTPAQIETATQRAADSVCSCMKRGWDSNSCFSVEADRNRFNWDHLRDIRNRVVDICTPKGVK